MSKKGGSLELNKIAASVFLAGLLAMTVSKITDNVYVPNEQPEKFGFAVEVPEAPVAGKPKVVEVVEVIDVAALLAAANHENGATIFKKKCTSCHNVNKGGEHSSGPNLWAIMETPIGQRDYNYSKDLSEKGGNWTEDNMFYWLKKPKKFAKGTKMSFPGIKKSQEIADLIAYLKKQAD